MHTRIENHCTIGVPLIAKGGGALGNTRNLNAAAPLEIKVE